LRGREKDAEERGGEATKNGFLMFRTSGIVGFEQNPESKLWVSIEIQDKIELNKVLLIGKYKIRKRIADNLRACLVGFSLLCSAAKLETKAAKRLRETKNYL
jgi:hypothetical protein